ncbi:hypothetical protein [Plantactinospora sp. GCM10030261]
MTSGSVSERIKGLLTSPRGRDLVRRAVVERPHRVRSTNFSNWRPV